jgi:hypothetical protein
MSGCEVRERGNGYQAVKCGKEATDVRLSDAAKVQRISRSQMREGSNRYQVQIREKCNGRQISRYME